MVSLRVVQSLDLNLLAALDALLQEGSVVRAAARVGLTAPAMSRALARLRVVMHDPLFVRAGRGLVPTPRAVALRDRVHASHGEARSLLGPDAPVEPARLRRRFIVRVDDAVVAALGPPLLARMTTAAPGVTVVFAAEGSEDVAELREGVVDLDIGVQGPLAPEIRTRKLLDDRRVALVRGATSRRALSLKALAERPHIDVSRRGRVRGPVDDALARHGLSRRVVAVVPNHLAAALLVAGGDAISLVSRAFARAIAPQLDVAGLAVPVELPAATVSMAWHPRFDADPAHAWFRDEISVLARRTATTLRDEPAVPPADRSARRRR